MTTATKKITVSWHSGITRARITEKVDNPVSAAKLVKVLKQEPGLAAREIRIDGQEV